ncbi:hypothetical protein BZA05DRAFT_149573 [Tricharina praecox]|uniref:uncharacterized protein n=1 Tax=Tricharina praecox TaxID=43433 RepID=UPI002221116D|nr:uncharacterized protein BZA05DRAFT_149573 [Tricharina praecox]KAI5845401.1 hypothetical protein BZA05DRAFT_149573 [Tricharina praecox]
MPTAPPPNSTTTATTAPPAPSTNEKRRPATHAPPALEAQTSTGSVNSNGLHAHEGIEGMGWDTLPLSVLHSYRTAYHLSVPSASEPYRNMVLNAGVGRRSPAGRGGGGRGRVAREVLATAVRKNFNAQPIVENEVIVNFLYSVKNQDKKFRLRFPPQK